MTWRSYGVLICAGLVLATAAGAEPAPPARTAALNEHRRPAEIPYPENNPYTVAKADLGRMLFFDPILSGSRTLSCAGCHSPGLSWGDGRPRAVGDRKTVMSLRAPTLIDVAWTDRLGWDGKFADLEAVAFAAIGGKTNMNLPEAEALARLAREPKYARAFAAAFDDGAITRRNVELALATFQRSIVAGEAPFDRWVLGDEDAIGPAAKRGFDLFRGKARCAECHGGPSFTDGSFHDIGSADGDDVGRGRLFPNATKLRYAFKTPTLRNAARRAPYMHDGSVPTLEAVIALYDRGGVERPSRSPLIRPLGLADAEKADLLAFLDSLTETPRQVALPFDP